MSTLATKLRLPAGRPAAVHPNGGTMRGATDLLATPWWHRRGVLGEITGEKGSVPVAEVAIDHPWTVLRFRRTA